MWRGPLKPEVVVAMSGGVDSSTAAAILKQGGFNPIGLTMNLWGDDSNCCSAEDVYDAKRVASFLDIPLYVIDFRRYFQREVLEPSIQEYTRGRTPNPCVLCNQRLKFKLLLRKARELGDLRLATGHYARIEYDSFRNRFVLKKGKDPDKEQSYWLATLPQEYLAKTILPLGRYSKVEIRELASELGLRVANKKESQDVCWAGNFQDTVKRVLEPNPGPILDKKGKLMGEHKGIHFYTVGQRKGLGIGASKPLYVIEIDSATNTIIVGEEFELYRQSFIGVEPNWVSIDSLNGDLEVDVKIRYKCHPARATISSIGEGVIVRFEKPQRAITPGQLAVFYSNDEVVGSSWIDRVIE